ncbi:transcriptional regulator [Streptomyces sp. So13.3]|uniref:helix-turn-helix domain-containing protein n=1 Tax=Streptomyces sp. So13.3 TaxID=2136173 RepID=UPI0011072E49|nr:helix-turn-helix domain-containing protein [Streptomyces sp. So13.3]QNA78252.1 transcriptional regulator [Streptomyces sp. So13.3]
MEVVVTGKRLSGAARDKAVAELVTDYENGASIRTLATLTGYSYGFIHRVLGEAGVTMRRRGGANRTKLGRSAAL